MATTQGATTLTIGNTGIIVPDLDPTQRASHARLVKVIARIPALNAGILYVESSDDGTNWVSVEKDIFEKAVLPTASSYTGGQRLMFGPYLPGTQFRIRSAVAQTATVPVYFGI